MDFGILSLLLGFFWVHERTVVIVDQIWTNVRDINTTNNFIVWLRAIFLNLGLHFLIFFSYTVYIHVRGVSRFIMTVSKSERGEWSRQDTWSKTLPPLAITFTSLKNLNFWKWILGILWFICKCQSGDSKNHTELQTSHLEMFKIRFLERADNFWKRKWHFQLNHRKLGSENSFAKVSKTSKTVMSWPNAVASLIASAHCANFLNTP